MSTNNVIRTNIKKIILNSLLDSDLYTYILLGIYSIYSLILHIIGQSKVWQGLSQLLKF